MGFVGAALVAARARAATVRRQRVGARQALRRRGAGRREGGPYGAIISRAVSMTRLATPSSKSFTA